MKILICGAGRMGTWFSDSLCLDHEVAVYERNVEKLKYLFHVKRFTKEEDIAVFKPDLLINAVSLHHTIDLFETLEHCLPDTCILSDIASVKNNIHEYYKKAGKPFVSTHPMFGPTFSTLRNLEKENAVIIKESDEKGKAFFRKFYQEKGISLYEYEFEEHDKIVAYSLTTPFVATLVFAGCMEKHDAPGTTFTKHFHIAQGLLSEDERLLSEIMFNKYSVRQIEKIYKQLGAILAMVSSEDTETFMKFIETLRNTFQQW